MAFSPPQVHKFHCHKLEGDLLWPGGEGGVVGWGQVQGVRKKVGHTLSSVPPSALWWEMGGRGRMPVVGGLGTACVLKQ